MFGKRGLLKYLISFERRQLISFADSIALLFCVWAPALICAPVSWWFCAKGRIRDQRPEYVPHDLGFKIDLSLSATIGDFLFLCVFTLLFLIHKYNHYVLQKVLVLRTINNHRI
jgi:hypothetical protein